MCCVPSDRPYDRNTPSSDSEEFSLTSLDSDSESVASGSSEFWDSRSSDGEDYLMMSAEDKGDDETNLIHQSGNLDLEMFNDDVKKRMFESDDDEIHNHKRQKMNLNDSAHDNDEISLSKDEGFESEQLIPVATSSNFLFCEDKFVTKAEDGDHIKAEIDDATAAA